MNESIWSAADLDDLRSELGEAYAGRTVLVTGADGFMGSHLTEALVELGANVHAFVRATSSGALNNIGHLRDASRCTSPTSPTGRRSTTSCGSCATRRPTGRTSSTSAPRPTSASRGTGRTRRYGEHVIGTLNLLQSVVDHGLEVEKFDTAGTSEEYGNVREAVTHHHDFDDEGGLILHERSPINPKSIYATSRSPPTS